MSPVEQTLTDIIGRFDPGRSAISPTRISAISPLNVEEIPLVRLASHCLDVAVELGYLEIEFCDPNEFRIHGGAGENLTALKIEVTHSSGSFRVMLARFAVVFRELGGSPFNPYGFEGVANWPDESGVPIRFRTTNTTGEQRLALELLDRAKL
jgi:hypothetical protein